MTTQPTDCSTDRRGCGELWAVAAFCTLLLIVPPVVGELYPFSAATMFAFPVEQCCVYEVRDPSGRRLGNWRFGLQMNNPHDPPVTTLGRYGYGRRSRFSITRYGKRASWKDVVEQVRRSLRKYPKLRYVYVTQKVLGPLNVRRVGLLQIHTWKVRNPIQKSE